jgi:lipoyl(octanoyl) transferase
MQTVFFQDLGEMEYGAVWNIQEQLLKRNITEKAQWYNTADTERPTSINTQHYFLLCAHPHVYTLGKSGHLEHLLVNDSRMKELNVTFYQTNRGGDITYHGPGQIVGYPILDLELFYTDLGKYMRSLEEVIIKVLAHYGISAGRIPSTGAGVWLDPETPNARKICALGVKSSRWVTMHGFAFNVNTDLNYFNYIVPCGLVDKGVTSLEKELGYKVDIEEVKALLTQAFEEVFDVALVNFTAPQPTETEATTA